MGIDGLWSESPDGELSFTMLTPNPDSISRPYHDRQVCVALPRRTGQLGCS